MSEELKGILRLALLVSVFLGITAAALWKIRSLERHIDELENAPADTIEVVKIDTLLIEKPVAVYKYIKKPELVEIPDTLTIHDTIEKVYQFPREYMVYKDSSYRAVVSGVLPRLDSIEIYQKNITQTITQTIKVTDKKRWGLGVNVGAGWNGKKVQPFVGIGVQYNLLRW